MRLRRSDLRERCYVGGKVASSSVERDLVEIMAVCHTVVPDEDGYQAESPDEEALVKGAAELGMKFTARSTEGVEVDGKRYLVLATIPFNSTRKRMSALVQGPDGKARILCKGADNIMFGLTGKDSFQRFAGGDLHWTTACSSLVEWV